MKIFKRKKNIILNNRKEKKFQKGIVLLFTIVIVSIVLSIAFGLINISLKEIKFSTSTSDTGSAFYASEAGIECALYYDYHGMDDGNGNNINPFETSLNYDLTCAGQEGVSLTTNYQNNESSEKEFTLNNLGEDGKACAIVTFYKNPDTTSDPSVPYGLSTIKSKGYNLGGDGDCDSSSPRLLEREIEVNY